MFNFKPQLATCQEEGEELLNKICLIRQEKSILLVSVSI